MSGLLGRAETSSIPLEEIRFGVILNGGVSLAVWMGGAVMELDRLTKAGKQPAATASQPGPPNVYAALLALAGSTARADVIAGTSAGGINGAALALSQVNPDAPLGLLRDIWVDQGRIEALMRQPFRGSPTSLLQGDEFFLPQLNTALGLLAAPGAGWRPPAQAPIDLSITTTVLRGNQRVSIDSMGQPLLQSIHGARFHWQRLPTTPPAQDPFSVEAVERTAHRLALASRSTASFPIAFEPSFVPVNSPMHPEPGRDMLLTDAQRLRPDMGAVVREWGDDQSTRNRSRFAVDGGLLANTPTRPALSAVEAMPASGPVRRIMLLVFPHAGTPGPDPADDPASPPTVLETVSGLLGALTAQGSRTFVEELEEHNKRAAGRRGTRGDILRSVGESERDPSAEIESLAAALYPHYRRLRRWRAARDLARRAVERPVGPNGVAATLPAGWGYERVRRAAENAQDRWQSRWRRPIPYVPPREPRLGEPEPTRGWQWGVTAALGVAETGADVVRRLAWVTTGDDYRTVVDARSRISELMGLLRDSRALTDDVWATDLMTALQPNESYWAMRLAAYERLMSGPVGDERLQATIAEVARSEAAARGIPDEELREQLTKALITEDAEPASAGDIVRGYVVEIVRALDPVLEVLDRLCGGSGAAEAGEVQDLHRWRDALVPGGTPLSPDDLLTRLLQLEIAATTLGDEVTSGATLPVEIAQLSAQTGNAFAQYTRTGDDKLGGMSVNRFGGFLKRSWRVNDWTWGRVDAASHLCRVVLHPARIRRTAQLVGFLPAAGEGVSAEPAARGAAEATVTEIVERLFPAELQDDPRIVALRDRAIRELTPVLNPTKPAEDLDAALPALADLFAWALHLEIVPSELPALAGAVRADGVDGANARSYGEVFVEEHEPLLTRLDRHRRGEGELTPQDRIAALEAFDRAGIGREPLQQEGTSDQMIRTATTAAAVAASVIDSERSGFSLVKPVTRVVRGVMLLPFWVVTGLTGKGVLGRSFSLLALAVGAVLLALSLFGALPPGLSGPAAAVGAGAVLAAFAIGALRSGTMLHGLVLLTPVVPLIVFAVNRALGDDPEVDAGTATAAGWGLSTLLVVVALAAALMVLGSLPATTGSVWAALDRLADRQNLRPVTRPPGFARGLAQARRRFQGLAASLFQVAAWVALAMGVVYLATWLAGDGWDVLAEWAADAGGWLIVAAVAAATLGMVVSFALGRQLQVLARQRTSEGDVWDFQALTHPAGASAGWAVLYGAGYLALAGLLSVRGEQLGTPWMRALIATSVVLGVLLVLVVPVWVPVQALRRIRDREVQRAVTAGIPPAPAGATPADSPTAASQATAWDLVARGVGYRALVRVPDAHAPCPELRRPVGTGMWKRIERERTRRAPVREGQLERG